MCLIFSIIPFLLSGCKEEEPPVLIINTAPVTGITTNSAISGGNISSNLGPEVIARGVVLSTSDKPGYPTLESNDVITYDGEGDGEFKSEMTGLLPLTSYRVRAYASFDFDTFYGPAFEFTSKSLPEVKTTAAWNITGTFVVIGGKLVHDGESPVTFVGVCWGTHEEPDLSGNYTNAHVIQGGFFSRIEGLEPNTTYYARAYATNDMGTGYGEQISFTTLEDETVGTVTDIDGNKYATVKYGNQEWMTENLRVTRYNDGTPISFIPENYDWWMNTSPAYSWYRMAYGALYNWYAIDQDSNGGRNICPVGWHVPDHDEWEELQNYLIIEGYNYDGSASGNMIAKAMAAPPTWKYSSDIGAPGNSDFPAKINASGFSALPGGHRDSNGSFNYIGHYGTWWSSTKYSHEYILVREIVYLRSRLEFTWSTMGRGLSVRCMREID